MSMTREEAREFLLSIANKLGYIVVEDLTDRDGKRMIEAIKALEEPQWISVSEQLPEEKGEYLVTYHPCYWDNVSSVLKVGIDSFRGKTAWAKNKHQRVIAWKPLDEPWRGDAE